MFENRLGIIQNVLKILDIETKVHNIFIYKGIYCVRNIIHNKYDTHWSLVDKPHNKFFLVDID